MNRDELIEAGLEAVRAACKVCVRVQADLVNAGTLEKGDKSPVTVADFASQAVVCGILAERCPDLVVVGEEGSEELRTGEHRDLLGRVAVHAGMPAEEAIEAIDRGSFDPATAGDDDPRKDRYWALDPIDGTKGFLRGEQYAVALGLIEGGEVVGGVLGCPNLAVDGQDEPGVVLVAVKGAGAYRHPVEGTDHDPHHGRKIAVSERSVPGVLRVCESVESGHTKQDAAAEVVRMLGVTADPVRMDSQAKYAAVAMGVADAYLRLPTRPGYVERIWDHAAGVAVLEEAGGTVTDVDGRRLDFSKGRGLDNNRGVIATNGPCHAEVVAAVGRALG
ncbi:3'(2'),5'-bisphosphate nucleotidase [Phycisphaera mikurensis]|uniref:3'(2'),5'-bisphosphate nucleotidase n=1 Tax=Phycisphaera mikurensis (strain NBRC 102666 / KCTC 22515 / FYK2301M01) TaxID=1142394 RepID=I0IH02_PHYMF|nr:3'(2'),5'-bisphosphate nucleotidase [Phycisphaera mikurensis]MBB6440796.1 3'(2'), 5'-bisphosphate nucleotidase [Phycisphaera mikurensis]BAM04540.1 3'(2'),5'-bisphosphate nucleotidase [Phycisphaera mikurensis NBRC 102666]